MSEPEGVETGAADEVPDRGGRAARKQTGSRPRRALLGARPADVAEQLRERDAQLAELRRDVAALWLAFGQHERTIGELIAVVERLAGVEIHPPGGRAPAPPEHLDRRSAPEARDPEPPSGAGANPAEGDRSADLATSISEQLSGLDDVLAAIEHATESLERTYLEEIADGEARAERISGPRGETGGRSG